MSTPNKRRKVEEENAAKSAVSAISALAARRRLASSSTPDPESLPLSDEVEFTTTQLNSFEALKALKHQERSSSASIQGLLRSSKPQSVQTNLAKSNREFVEDVPEKPELYAPLRQIQYSSCTLSKSNYRLRNGGISELRLNSERLLLLGSFGIRVISGELRVWGASFGPSDQVHWIHAPSCHALPVLRTGEKTRMEIHPHPGAPGLRMLGEISPLFQKLWNDSTGDEIVSTYQILCSSEDAPKKCILQDLVSPPEWNKELALLQSSLKPQQPLSILVCGPKSSGKSTFSKLLTNRLMTAGRERITSVAVLDLDPGQPEYTPSGMVSLVDVKTPNLGTPFTHPGFGLPGFRIVRSHTLASVTPASAVELYRECMADLFKRYKSDLTDIPLIINTPGWILGTGLDLLAHTIEYTQPSHVVYMSEEGPVESVDIIQQATKNSFSMLPSQHQELNSRTAAQFRAMQMMSYFHSTKPSAGIVAGGGPWFSRPLSAVRPLQIRYSGPCQGIMGIVSYDNDSPPELLSSAIDGMILALAVVENPDAFRNMRPSSEKIEMVSRTAEEIPFLPNPNDSFLDPRFSSALGLVLVRSIDIRARALNVLTPIPLENIEKARSGGLPLVLVHGRFDTPVWAYTEDLFRLESRAQKGEDQKQSNDGSADLEKERNLGDQDYEATPWIEVLKANRPRPKGSKVWRVRRDLGKND